MTKTNAARLLDQMRIAYRVLEYPVGDDHLDAVQVAALVGLEPERVFKTLVARGDRHGHCMAIVPGPATLDLKALARASADRIVAPIALKDVTPDGICPRGRDGAGGEEGVPGVSGSALGFSEVAVSAGKKGLQLMLRPQD